MGGPPLRGNYVINTPEATPTPHSVPLTHTQTHTHRLSRLAVCHKLYRSGCESPSLSVNEAAIQP